MLLYSLPAIISIAFKLGLVVLSVKYWKTTKRTLYQDSVVLVCIACIFQNAFEIPSYYSFGRGVIFLKIYYCAAIITLLSLYFHSKALLGKINPYYFTFFIGAGLCLIILLFSSDFLVSGFRDIGYSITRIKGQYYSLFNIFVFTILLMTLINIILALNSESKIKQARSSIVLVAFIFTFLVIITIISLMEAGLDVNFTIIIPIVSTITLAGYVFAQQTGLFNFSAFIPFTNSWKRYKSIRVLFVVGEEEYNLKDRMDEIESFLIEEAIEQNKKNKAATARSLGLSPSGLSNKLRKLKGKINNS